MTLRSTDNGTTWSVLERRLDGAMVLNGSPLLGSAGTGTQRIGTEQMVTDAMGVLRSGAYGPGLNSALNPLRGDAGVEETLRGLQINLVQRQRLPTPTPIEPTPFDLNRCQRAYDNCAEACTIVAVICISAAYAVLVATLYTCKTPWCIRIAISTFEAARRLCRWQLNNCHEGCLIEFEDCINVR